MKTPTAGILIKILQVKFKGKKIPKLGSKENLMALNFFHYNF